MVNLILTMGVVSCATPKFIQDVQQQDISNTNHICIETDEVNKNTLLTPLVNITPLTPDILCQEGGINIQLGKDLNFNTKLDENEVSYFEEICNSTDGLKTLVITKEDSKFCEDGGMTIETGVDINKNGLLDKNEIKNTSHICNGVDGDKTLIKTMNINDGPECEFGGIVMYTGLDSNYNSILDNSEIVTTDYICNDRGGFTNLSYITNSPPTDVFNGSSIIKTGLDLNNDKLLQENEVTTSYNIINGIKGLNPLIKRFNIQPNNQFPNGGIKIWYGLDLNNDNNFTINEIINISSITNGLKTLNGINGINTLIKATEENRGTLIQLGLDLNGNNLLDNNEISDVFPIFNDKSENLTSLINVTEENPGLNCKFGGLKIETGEDINKNTKLDENEVLSVNYIQNQEYQLSNKLIDFENFNVGDKISNISFNEGCKGVISVIGKNPVYDTNEAMIFNSNNPTGNNNDLAVNQGNILIISEDDNSDNPDDLSDNRGYILFDFLKFNPTNINNGNVIINSIDLIDMDNNTTGKIKLYDNNFNQIGADIKIPKTTNKGVITMDINVISVAKMYIFLGGSGGIDNLDISYLSKI